MPSELIQLPIVLPRHVDYNLLWDLVILIDITEDHQQREGKQPRRVQGISEASPKLSIHAETT